MKVTDSTNDQLMCIAAFRYSLSRRSYIVGSCLEWLPTIWADLTANTRNVIVRDTIEAIQDDDPAPEWRAWRLDSGWKRFAEWAWAKLDDDGRAWVRHAVAHRDKPWPLGEGSHDAT